MKKESLKLSKLTSNYILHRLFIGANNKTGRVDEDKLRAVLDRVFEGYTMYGVLGRWKGTNENSCIVEVEDCDEAKVRDTIAELLITLEQHSIGYQKLPWLEFVGAE